MISRNNTIKHTKFIMIKINIFFHFEDFSDLVVLIVIDTNIQKLCAVWDEVPNDRGLIHRRALMFMPLPASGRYAASEGISQPWLHLKVLPDARMLNFVMFHL